MQMAMPALPPMVQGEKAQPSVYEGINGLLDKKEIKDGVAWLKGLFPSQEEQQAGEFDGLIGGMAPQGMPQDAMGIMPSELDWMKGGQSFAGLGGLLGSWF